MSVLASVTIRAGTAALRLIRLGGWAKTTLGVSLGDAATRLSLVYFGARAMTMLGLSVSTMERWSAPGRS
jgi:hypothetical protein